MLGRPVDGADDPWESHAEEDVDGVGSGNVANGGVSVLGGLGSGHRGEGIGQGGSHGHKGDTSHGRLKVDDASENGSDLTDDGGHDTDKEESHAESGPTTSLLTGRNDGAEDLPEHGKEVPKG